VVFLAKQAIFECTSVFYGCLYSIQNCVNMKFCNTNIAKVGQNSTKVKQKVVNIPTCSTKIRQKSVNESIFTDKQKYKDIKKSLNYKAKKEKLNRAYREYVESESTKDNYFAAWQSLGLFAAKTTQANKDLNTRYGKFGKTNLSFFDVNNVFLVKDFTSDTTYNPYSFAKAFTNTSEYKSDFYKRIYNLLDYREFAIREEEQSFISSNREPKHISKPVKTILSSLEKTKEYFENRIYSELGLTENEAKDYFFPYFDSPYGIGIKYTNLEKEPIKYGSENKDFDRIRLTTPKDKKKYHSHNGSGYFPYITPLANNQDLFESENVLYSIEGEFKAFFAVQKLKIACIGIGGLHLGVTTEKEIDVFGRKRVLKNTAEFLPLTKQIIEKGKFESYGLIFDSDTFQNISKKDRSSSFFTAIERQIIAAKKMGIKQFVFSCINPDNKYQAKGLDDLAIHCEPSEIRKKLESNSYHNDLFWHFKFDLTQDYARSLKNLQDTFKASSQIKLEPTKIRLNGYLGSQLLENTAFQKSILKEKYTFLEAPTGLGKSYFVQHYLTPFLNKKGYTVLFAAPRNAIAKQQAAEKEKIVFTADTVSKAIERLKTEQKDIVYTNFDKLHEAYKVLTELHGLKVFIVVDEAHLIPFDSSFRADVIGSVLDTLKENPTNLLMTATPTELSFPTKNFKVISTDKKAYNRPNLVFCSDSKMTTYALEEGLQVIEKGHRVIIHCNDLDAAKTLKKSFNSHEKKVHLFASNGLDTQEKEVFEEMQTKSTFIWNDDTDVIITTSVLEAGINIKTDRAVTNIYLNKTPFGFDNISFRQFIARVRNYNEFEVENIIVTKNYKHFLPSENLVLRYDYQTSLELAFENALHHSNQMERLIANDTYEKDRFSSMLSQNVYLNESKGYFDINYQNIFADFTRHSRSKGSPFFENPTKIFFYDNEIDNNIEAHTKELESEKEKAENEVVSMFYEDFDCLLKSVNKETKDVRLESQTTITNDSIEPIQLTALQLQIAEKLLIGYFQLLKTSPHKGIKDVPKLKNILACKKSSTMRKTQDLSKRKNEYISYWLLDRKEKGGKLGTKEFFRIEEYRRVISVLKQTKGQKLTAQEITNKINKGKHQKNRYTKKIALSICQMLCEISENTVRIDSKKTAKIYQFESVKIWEKELGNLTE